MKVENVKIEELTHAEYNPRQITEKQFRDIRRSIKKFGFLQPLVVNRAEGRENVIIGGNQRFEILKRDGHKTVPVVFVDIKDIEKEKELNIRLNKNQADWDWDMLANQFDIDDLSEWGFKESDFREPNRKKKMQLKVYADSEEQLRELFDKLSNEGYRCELKT